MTGVQTCALPICCYHGVFFGIECKAGKNKPTPLQDKNLKQIRDAGGLDLVVNEENMHKVRDELMDCGKPAL